jgi:septal ring factor EnvC (AmiA/AmiB activator)
VSDEFDNAARITIPGRSNWLHFLFSGVILLGSMAFYETTQAERLGHEVAQLRHDNSALQTGLSQSNNALRRSMTAFHNDLDQLHADLAGARAETTESLAVARDAAVRHADALARSIEKKRNQQETQLSAELSRVEQSTAETSTRLTGISSDVGSVKSEVESVQSAARQTTAGLQETRADIATNSDEIQTIRDRGDRNVYEFTLAKSSGMQRIGDIQVVLERTDVKHNVFTVEIVVADQRVEKRDRNANEPVQFYVPGKSGQPYELVVNEVGRNTVKGYLTSPKAAIARDESASSD